MKIISLQPSVTLILERLGCLNSLAACTKYCLDVVPSLRDRNLPVVRDSWSTQPEDLLPVAADLIIASVPYRQESLTAILKSGHPVLALAPHTLADIFTDIRLIASTLNVPENGESVITSMRTAIHSVRTRAQSLPHRPLVYCEEWGKPLIHSQPWVAELVEIAGGRFLGKPGAITTPEAIAAAQPDIILAAWCGAGSRVPLEKIIDQRQWQHLPAARDSRVYCIADELLNTPAPTLVDGLHAIASAIHPGIFSPSISNAIRRIRTQLA
ncbi:MAG TPA: ABC transporter substrate-binding protein [Acidobacteriaceae bacterium]|nr:ABC transporter substrate-binding protein [Acidobacteriaceae bacterium]